MQTVSGLRMICHLPDSRWAKQNCPNKAPPSHTSSGSPSYIQNLSFCCENNAHHSQSTNWFHHHSLAERWQNRCCHGFPKAKTLLHANQGYSENSAFFFFQASNPEEVAVPSVFLLVSEEHGCEYAVLAHGLVKNMAVFPLHMLISSGTCLRQLLLIFETIAP